MAGGGKLPEGAGSALRPLGVEVHQHFVDNHGQRFGALAEIAHRPETQRQEQLFPGATA